MRPARLLVAAGVLWVTGVLGANLALKGHITTSGVVSAVLGIVIVLVLLVAAGVFKSSGDASRQEQKWEDDGHGPWQHRKEGDPR